MSGGFIVSRGDSAKILESAKHAFNSVSLFVCVFAVLDRRFTAASSRNDAGALTAVEVSSQFVAIISLIGNEDFGGLESFQ